MIVAFTGHRPLSLGGYSERIHRKLLLIARHWLIDNKPDKAIIGMALGWDQAVAQGCRDISVPYVAAIPFTGQELSWPDPAQRRYRHLLAGDAERQVISDGVNVAVRTAMQKRNEWMVNNSQKLIALWNGNPGGTGNCVRYAEKVGKPVVNLWDKWTA